MTFSHLALNYKSYMVKDAPLSALQVSTISKSTSLRAGVLMEKASVLPIIHVHKKTEARIS